jgi:hypothetical protein
MMGVNELKTSLVDMTHQTNFSKTFNFVRPIMSMLSVKGLNQAFAGSIIT